jgi:hypothetical protein
MSQPSRPQANSQLARLAALAQGILYLVPAFWAMGRKEHYKRVHQITGNDDWMLRTHAAWMGIIGALLLSAGATGHLTRQTRALGFGAAAQLAANDIYSIRKVPAIYRLDLALEIPLAIFWGLWR